MGKGNPGINNLARALTKRMKTEGKQDLVLDFGSITASGGLLTNTFPAEIPKSDYLVCRSLAIGSTGDELLKAENGTVISIPETMRSTLPGDRVLVAWVQDDPVVIDIIVSADSL